MLFMALIVAAVIILVITTLRRMFMCPRITPVFWPLLLLAAAMPIYVGWRVLYPGEPVDTAWIEGEEGTAELTVPEGYSLMATAELGELEDPDTTDLDDLRTHYVLEIDGEGWGEHVTGKIRRESSGGGPEVSPDGRSAIRGTERRGVGAWGQRIQDRFELRGTGEISVDVYNWQGQAAERIRLDVVRGPPPLAPLVVLTVVLGLVAVFADVRLGADRISADIGFLTFAGLFLTDGVTPQGDLRSLIFNVSAALLVGGLSFGAVATIAEKIFGRADPTALASDPGAPPSQDSGEDPSSDPARKPDSDADRPGRSSP